VKHRENKGAACLVGIAGAGAVALGVSAVLERGGHRAMLWSPSGRLGPSGFAVEALGAVSGRYAPAVATEASALAAADVIIFCLPAYAHKTTMEAVAPVLRGGQVVIVSSHASFSAAFLDGLLRERGLDVPVIAWNTTALTARVVEPAKVSVSSVRKTVSYAPVHTKHRAVGGAICRKLFPCRFVEKQQLAETLLSNLNPMIHMAMALCNITRMERAENWCQRWNVTPGVGRLIEALDDERLKLAAAMGRRVPSIFENYGALAKPGASVSDINQRLHEERAVAGPKTLETRYVLEDAPFGLAVMVELGRVAGVAMPLHDAGLRLLSGIYGREFAAENDLLPEVELSAFLR
jgi:opine dehydrogenase